MKRGVVGYLVALVLALSILAPVWALFPASATPESLRGATMDQMRRATEDMEAYPFLTMIDEKSQIASWRMWVKDGSAKSSVFLVGAERMQGKLVKVTGAVLGGILLSVLVSGVTLLFGKFDDKLRGGRDYYAQRRVDRLVGRAALILLGLFLLSFAAPILVCNHPMALLFSVPLAIGFTIAVTGKKAPQTATDQPAGPVPPGQGA